MATGHFLCTRGGANFSCFVTILPLHRTTVQLRKVRALCHETSSTDTYTRKKSESRHNFEHNGVSIPQNDVRASEIHHALQALAVIINSHGTPSAVKKYADCLPRTWLPHDARPNLHLVRALWRGFEFVYNVSWNRPLGERLEARRKYVYGHFKETLRPDRC